MALLTLLGAGVVLSRAEPRLQSADNVRLIGFPLVLDPGQQVCQTGEQVPAGRTTLTMQVGPQGGGGPPLTISAGARRVEVPAGYAGGELHVALPDGAGGAFPVCFRNQGKRAVGLGGQDQSIAIPPGIGLTIDGKVTPLAVQIRWLGPSRSGWSDVGAALRRWGYVTAFGAATPYLAILAFALSLGGALALAVRGRATAAACATIGFLAATGWALTTPIFHVPDEPQHIAYEQRLAESGKVPVPVPGPVFSNEEGVTFAGVQFNNVAGNPAAGRPPWTALRSDALRAALDRDPGRYTLGGLTNTTNNPPLYYLAELGPYWAATAAGGDFLDRVLAMRLGSALLIGLSVFFAFRFLGELLPRTPWAWPAGALALAVQPLAGFVGGGVNNDAGLFAAGAAVLWLTARALRRGLDRRGAIGIGLAFGLGLITKATLLGLAPGLVVCAAVVLLRSRRRRETAGRIGMAVAAAAVPVAGYLLVNHFVWDRGLWSGGGVASTTTSSGRPAQLSEFLSYLWQFYLPRLPFMTDQQAGLPVYNVWFKGLIGRFGWLDTSFPEPVYKASAVAFAGVLVLAAAALWRARRSVRRLAPEALVLIAAMAGFAVTVGWAGYRGRLDTGQIFEQARYLLPLGALYAGLIALAARGAGRWGRAVGAALVTLACAHALFSVGLVVSRYYA